MQAEDLEEVMAIESEGHTRPWPKKIFLEELARSYARLLVVRVDGSPEGIAAYCNYWLVAGEAQLLNIVTGANYRRQGHALLLMHHIFDELRRQQCVSISLEVRRSNIGAISLYRSLGFEHVGVRAAYYADNKEDAIVMIATF